MNYQKMAADAKRTAAPETIRVIHADQVKSECIDWWWPGRFARGKFGILGGNPERGEGLTIADVVARVTRGRPWPCNESRAEVGDCVIIQCEDGLADTIIPRLDAAGADRSRVRILNMIDKADGSGERMIDITKDVHFIEGVLNELPNPQLLIIDPVPVYFGKFNAAAGNDVRAALAPLVNMLERLHIGGVGIMHFNKKVDVENALARIADSVAFGAVARHCFVITDDPENNRRLFVKAKNNLAPDIKALAFHVEEVSAGTDHRDGRTIRAPRVVWAPEHVEISAAQAMRAEAGGTAAANPRAEAKKMLLETLANGPVSEKDIEERAHAELISKATLRRAKGDLGIVSYKNGMAGGWAWRMPDGTTAGEVKGF